jgi:four helix bundle protein
LGFNINKCGWWRDPPFWGASDTTSLLVVFIQKIYALTNKGQFARDYGLMRQIQNAAGSAMHNIAEGFDSDTNAEFLRFLRYAKRSCSEVQSELYIALDQKYISKTEFQNVYDHADRTRATIRGFIKYLLTYAKKSQQGQRETGNTKRETPKGELL